MDDVKLENLVIDPDTKKFIADCERAIKTLEQQKAEFNDKYVDFSGVNNTYDFAIRLIKEKIINTLKGRK